MIRRGRWRARAAALALSAVGVAGLAGLGLAVAPPSPAGATTHGTGSAGTVAAKPSPGCRSARPIAPGTTTVAFAGGGDTGSYVLEVPPGYTGHKPLPVVVDLHGYEESASLQVSISGLGTYGATHGFVTVTPQADQKVPHWDTLPGSTDRAFIAGLLNHLNTSLCVDQHRVYLTGYSNGAFMTSALVCQLAGRIAAAAPVAGVQAPSPCHPSRPVPVIAFHGTGDQFVPYQGGVGSKVKTLVAPDGKGTLEQEIGTSSVNGISPSTLPIPTELARWAKRNHCGATPVDTPVAADVTRIAYRCPAHDDVVLYRVTGGGHAWPGSPVSASIASVVGPTTMSISADQLMWAFFVAHPLRS